MKKKYKISSFILDSGERYYQVVDYYSGLPEYYPNLFLTTQVRNRSKASSTLESAASHLVVLLRFLDRHNIVMEKRLLSGEFLREHELDALCDFTQHRFRSITLDTAPSPIFGFDEFDEVMAEPVQNGTQYARLTTAAHYIGWLSRHLLSDPSRRDVDRIDSLVRQIKERRPAKKGRTDDRLDKSLDEVQISALFEVIRLGSDLNPFSQALQRRNRVMILLLYHLGLRGGELLKIRISDIDIETNRITIVRRPDEMDDPRVDEPNAKTEGRILPVADSLMREVHDYITQDRRRVPNARRNDFLFVIHKVGPTVGQPISKPSYYKVIAVVADVAPQLYAVTGHMLRHTWNYKFSEHMDSMDEPSSTAQQEACRSYLMGWKPGSGTATTYNERFTRRKGMEASLALQKSSPIRQPAELKNDQ